MNDTPDVSVVMSVYNGADYLRETIDSVLAQEAVSFEFIIVNDGSNDESPEILDEYASRDSRVKILNQENQGLTKALIRGCADARGTYIARHDVGDVSHPRRLALQKRALDETHELAFVSCWTEFCGPEWEHLYCVRGTDAAASPIYILRESETHGVIDGPAHHGSVMFTRDAYVKAGGYRLEFSYGQDWDLWYRLAAQGDFQMIGETLYKVRILPEAISVSRKDDQHEFAQLSRAALRLRMLGLSDEQVLLQAEARRMENDKKMSRAAAGFYFIGECLRRNQDRRAITYFKRSIKESPLAIKSWVRIFQCMLGRGFNRVVG